ncbi:MAG: hypothetical protein Q4B03_06950 [Lachnospiraceae bacterium]|nr:hypothetical protein [Lachnospiraceae bacterium]
MDFLFWKFAPQKKQFELHRLLKALLSTQLSSREKLDIIENEYHITESNNIREEVNHMCNLSQGVKEEGIAIGEAKGKLVAETRIILSMHNKGFTLDQIAYATEKGLDEIESILRDSKEAE